MFLDLDKQDRTATAVIDDRGARLTYGELSDAMNHVAGKGFARGVAFCLCENVASALLGYLSLVNAGAVPLMLSAELDRELLAALADEYRPAYWWAPEGAELPSPGGLGEARELDEQWRHCGYRLFSTGEAPYELNGELELLMTTSGSTGSAKLVRYKRGNLEANAVNVAHAFGWTADERGVCDLPFHYTMGLNVANSLLASGATVLAASRNLMDPLFWEFVREQGGTSMCGVPYSYEIMRRIRIDEMDLPELKTLAQGGGKLTDKLFRWLADFCASSGRRFVATFGTTETSARMMMLPPELAQEKTGSIGRAIPPGEAFLDSAAENEAGELEGELCFRGPNVTMGYARCRADLAHGDDFAGVYRTGDIARVDADGCYYIVGRKGRFLKLFGMRVGLDECERLVKQHFGCDCACAGDDKRMVVYVDDKQAAAEVVAYLSGKTKLHKSAFKAVVIDAIPRNEYGKVKLAALEKIEVGR